MAHIRVGGVDIPIINTEMDDFGQYVSSSGYEIRLSDSISGSLRDMTLIHEVIHAVSDHYGLEFSEKTVRVLETAVVQIIRDNPVMMSSIIASLGE